MGADTLSTILTNRPGLAQAPIGTAERGDERHTWAAGDTETAGADVLSFEDGLLAHLPILHHAAFRLTRRQLDAEDLVQETVARALAHRAQFRPGTNLRAWLLTIERSIFLNATRRMRTAPAVQSMDEMDESALYGAGGMSTSPSAEHVLVQGWIDDAIVQALRVLPAHYSAAVLLCDVQGLSYAEIAQQMGCALGTVMSRLHRGRTLLRQTLAGRDGDTRTTARLAIAA